MSDSSTLFCEKKPRGRVPLKRLSYEMFIDIVRFLVTFNIKWTEFNRFLSTHIFLTLMFFYNGDSFNRFTSGVKNFLSKCDISMRDSFIT